MDPIRCEGAPRDLGVDQGRGCAPAVRVACARLELRPHLARWLPLLPQDDEVQALTRDLTRYFPHMAERTAGLARGAGVARSELGALLAHAAGDAPDAAFHGAIVAVEAEGEEGPLLLRSLSGPVCLRRSEPDNDYASLELTAPWLVAPQIGVNEHGLAAAVVHRAPPSAEGCRAPAALLAQDCLQRFDTTQKALEWCQRRPAGGRASLVLADAKGDIAEIRIDGESRTLARPIAGTLVAASDDATTHHVRKALAELAPRTAPALSTLVASTATAAALADTATRRVTLGGGL